MITAIPSALAGNTGIISLILLILLFLSVILSASRESILKDHSPYKNNLKGMFVLKAIAAKRHPGKSGSFVGIDRPIHTQDDFIQGLAIAGSVFYVEPGLKFFMIFCHLPQ